MTSSPYYLYYTHVINIGSVSPDPAPLIPSAIPSPNLGYYAIRVRVIVNLPDPIVGRLWKVEDKSDGTYADPQPLKRFTLHRENV